MATPKARVSQRVYGAGALFALPEGSLGGLGTTLAGGAFEPDVANGQFTIGTAAGNVPGHTAAIPLGITTDGMTFTTGIDTEDDEAAEYYYPINTLVTGRTVTLSAELKHVNLSNLRLALNHGASPLTAGDQPSATTAFRLTPPLPGQENRVQLLWVSQNNDLCIVVYRALQTGELSMNPNKGADGVTIGLEFTGQLPDASIAVTPFDIFGAGAKFAETAPGVADII